MVRRLSQVLFSSRTYIRLSEIAPPLARISIVCRESVTTGDMGRHGDKSGRAMTFHFLFPVLPALPVVVTVNAIANRSSVRLWLGFGDEHDVVEHSSARAGQLFAVVRPVEPEDLIGREVGQLFRRAAVKRLMPDVRSAVAGRD